MELDLITKNGNKYCNIRITNNTKKELIKIVHTNSKKIYGIQKPINIIEDLYCDLIQNNNNVTITGLWFAKKSWGTYFDYITTTNNFIDSDSDFELFLE